jgi:hypothetical protein
MARLAALLLALSRIGFGVVYLLRPQKASDWVGRPARKPGGRLLTRALGARDLALAGGTVAAVAMRDHSQASRWLAAQAVADGADLAATLAERDRLSPSQLRLGAGMAAASTGLAIGGALGLARSAGPVGTRG